jgi:hypothetical protein
MAAKRKFALAFLLIGAARAWAGPPTPFSTLFAAADTVFIGTLESARPIPQADARTSLRPEPSPSLLLPSNASQAEIDSLFSPWEFRVRVQDLIEARSPSTKPGSVVEVVWYVPSRQNVPAHSFRDGDATGKPALWLLRTERGLLRTVSDGSQTVFPMRGLSADTENRLSDWKDPRLAVIYLVLKPGLIITEERYAFSNLPADVSALVPFIDFLRVYRSVYLDSDDRQRGLISLSAAAFGFCLQKARGVADAQRRLRADVPKEPLLDKQMERRTDDVDLRQMSWTTKEELLKELRSPAEAVSALAKWACSSDGQVRERARDLLSRYFSMDTTTLPCLPCE